MNKIEFYYDGLSGLLSLSVQDHNMLLLNPSYRRIEKKIMTPFSSNDRCSGSHSFRHPHYHELRISHGTSQ